MIQRRSRRTLPATAGLALALVAVAAPRAQVAAETDPLAEGRLLYRVHCSGCHGVAARGDGPMREQLESPPADLSMIRQAHDGEFPFDKVYRVIDGRRELPTHGTREMPVWGFSFQTLGRDTDQEAEVRGRITALTRYLESLQKGPEP